MHKQEAKRASFQLGVIESLQRLTSSHRTADVESISALGALIASTDTDLEAQAFREERSAAAAEHIVSAMSILAPLLKGRLFVGQQLPGKPSFHARWQQRLCIVAGPRSAVPAEHKDAPRDNTPTTPAPLRGVSAGGGGGGGGGSGGGGGARYGARGAGGAAAAGGGGGGGATAA